MSACALGSDSTARVLSAARSLCILAICGATLASCAPINVPVRHSASGIYVLVSVHVNGIAGNFLVDTGSTHTIVAKSFAERIGLAKVASQEANIVDATGVELPLPSYFANIDSLRVGSIRVGRVRGTVPVVDLANLNRIMGEELDGVLGNNILASADYILNVRKPSLLLARNIGLSDSQMAQKLTVAGSAIYLPMTIASKSLDFRLDTGSNASFITREAINSTAAGNTELIELQDSLLGSTSTRTFQKLKTTVNIAGVQISKATLLVAEKNVVGLDLLSHGELSLSGRDRKFEFREIE